MAGIQTTVKSGDGESAIVAPYVARLRIQGVSDMLFHRWSNEEVEAKSKAAKGSAAKKTDNLESYVYRLENGNLAIPGEYLRMAMVMTAKFFQDPRSPRKSAFDLMKAALAPLTDLADTGKATWDYEDRRRVMIQRNGVTRVRPALLKGWEAEFDFMVTLPEYVGPQLLKEVLDMAGRVTGVGDFRPTFGRFTCTHFEVVQDEVSQAAD